MGGYNIDIVSDKMFDRYLAKGWTQEEMIAREANKHQRKLSRRSRRGTNTGTNSDNSDNDPLDDLEDDVSDHDVNPQDEEWGGRGRGRVRGRRRGRGRTRASGGVRKPRGRRGGGATRSGRGLNDLPPERESRRRRGNRLTKVGGRYGRDEDSGGGGG